MLCNFFFLLNSLIKLDWNLLQIDCVTRSINSACKENSRLSISTNHFFSPFRCVYKLQHRLIVFLPRVKLLSSLCINFVHSSKGSQWKSFIVFIKLYTIFELPIWEIKLWINFNNWQSRRTNLVIGLSVLTRVTRDDHKRHQKSSERFMETEKHLIKFLLDNSRWTLRDFYAM